MFVVAVFVIVIGFVWQYNYERISNQKLREQSEDRITYRDSRGRLRLLSDNSILTPEKGANGRTMYRDRYGMLVDYSNLTSKRDAMEGKYDYYFTGCGLVCIETGKEEYFTGVHWFNHRQYYTDGPHIVRETKYSAAKHDDWRVGVDIETFNRLSDKEKKYHNLYNEYYFGMIKTAYDIEEKEKQWR